MPEVAAKPLDPSEYLTAYRATHEPSGAASADLWVMHLVQFLGNRPLTAEELYRWRARLVEEGYKPSSINKAAQTVKVYLKYLRITGLLKMDADLIGIALATAHVPYRLPQMLEPGDIRKLAVACDPTTPVAKFFCLGILTAMRPGEVLRCRPENFNPSLGVVCYSTKTKRERVIPAKDSPALQTIIRAPWAPGKSLCEGFSIFVWNEFTKRALGRKVDRKVLRSTYATYAASSDKLTEFDYVSRMGHGTGIASQFYRVRREGVTGDTVEEWLGAKDELRSLSERICQCKS